MVSRTFTTRLIEGPAARLLVDGAELRVARGPDKGVRVSLGAASVLVGSGANCDLVLHDPTVSLRHAEIQITRHGYSLRDLESTNGIRVGKTEIDRMPLAAGLRFTLGETDIVVHATGAPLEIALASAGDHAGLVARSVKMRAFVAELEQLAPSDVTVLIEGETGTGKEVAALALHRLSARCRGPFSILDCAALSSTMAAAEILGHERGAFTGADTPRAGLFESADGGTLFIDEVGELPLDLQPLLLGCLERKRSRRIGGSRDIAHDVRVVAATHRNLAEEVRQGRFRQDLYYRLTVGRLRVPPLRDRPEDIIALADDFAREIGVELSPEARLAFCSHDWPGNVRELRNALLRIGVRGQSGSDAMFDDSGVLAATDLMDESGKPRPWFEARSRAQARLESSYVAMLLRSTGGNLTHAAQLAGITRQSITTLAKKHGLHQKPE